MDLFCTGSRKGFSIVNMERFLANIHVRYMLSPVRPSGVCLSLTFVYPTQANDIFGTVFMPFGT